MRDCTCLGTCRGAAGLGEDWRCVMVEYEPRAILGGHIDETDVALVATRTCTQFKCQKWDAGVPVAPKLVRGCEDGFWFCPVCRGSYGSQPF